MPMLDDQLDLVIDEVAREMTAGEPRGDLRARVMARVETDGRHGARRLQPSLWHAAFAAAALALIAVVTYRETQSPVRLKPPVEQLRATVRSSERPDTQPATSIPTSRDPVAPAVRPASTSRASKRVAIPPSPLDALAPAPLAVAPITTSDLDTPSIDLTPLDTIPPMAIAPLGDEGDRR